MSYYVQQKFVNGQPVETYYVKRSSMSPLWPISQYLVHNLEQAKDLCDTLNHPPKVEFRKVYP